MEEKDKAFWTSPEIVELEGLIQPQTIDIGGLTDEGYQDWFNMQLNLIEEEKGRQEAFYAELERNWFKKAYWNIVWFFNLTLPSMFVRK
jgi:hypothetical protein